MDDESIVRKLGRRMLVSLGFKVELGQDGREALAQIRADPGRYCAAIIDATMPEVDGLECLRSLRQLCPDLPVVISSGHDEQALSQRFAGESVQALLPKPFRLASLSAALRAAIGADTDP